MARLPIGWERSATNRIRPDQGTSTRLLNGVPKDRRPIGRVDCSDAFQAAPPRNLLWVGSLGGAFANQRPVAKTDESEKESKLDVSFHVTLK